MELVGGGSVIKGPTPASFEYIIQDQIDFQAMVCLATALFLHLLEK